MNNGSERLRRELMVRVVRAWRDGTLENSIDSLPSRMRPRNEPSSRCCVYHDRAVLKYRLMALLGFACEDETDEGRSLRSYFDEARKNPPHAKAPLTVAPAGCAGCPESLIDVTSNCRGCLARPCTYVCPVGAISLHDQRARVDHSKCIKCGKCLEVCPFNAIIRTHVPCEEACPVKAIHKNEFGLAEIDFDRCIYCGKCFAACPFGAVMERSQLMSILRALREKRRLIALVAPSAQFQFPGGIERLFSAIHRAGFAEVMEVALGAEMTSEHEGHEFVERMARGDKLMTTSCCTAYVELVRKHVPKLVGALSQAASPMQYAGELARRQSPDCETVFIGPCIAKRFEAMQSDEIDYVMTFEELGALLAGLGIDVMGCEPWPIPRPAAATARNFAKSCGVTEAVLSQLLAGQKLESKFLNGIDRKSVPLLMAYAAGKLPGNFLEVMSCPGGCVGGPCSLVPEPAPPKTKP